MGLLDMKEFMRKIFLCLAAAVFTANASVCTAMASSGADISRLAEICREIARDILSDDALIFNEGFAVTLTLDTANWNISHDVRRITHEKRPELEPEGNLPDVNEMIRSVSENPAIKKFLDAGALEGFCSVRRLPKVPYIRNINSTWWGIIPWLEPFDSLTLCRETGNDLYGFVDRESLKAALKSLCCDDAARESDNSFSVRAVPVEQQRTAMDRLRRTAFFSLHTLRPAPASLGDAEIALADFLTKDGFNFHKDKDLIFFFKTSQSRLWAAAILTQESGYRKAEPCVILDEKWWSNLWPELSGYVTLNPLPSFRPVSRRMFLSYILDGGDIIRDPIDKSRLIFYLRQDGSRLPDGMPDIDKYLEIFVSQFTDSF